MKPKYKVGDLLHIGAGTYVFITGVEKKHSDAIEFYEMYNLKFPETEMLRECTLIEDIVKMAMR